MAKKRAHFTVTNSLKDMSVEEFFAGLEKQQTRRGKKYSYNPVDPTIHPAGYATPIFQLDDIDDLSRIVPDFPSKEMEIQKCDREQNLSWLLMARRRAFFELLNQAVWRYIAGRGQNFIGPKALLNKLEFLRSAIQNFQKLLGTKEQDEAGKFIIECLEEMGAPLVKARLVVGNVWSFCGHLEIMLRRHTQKINRQRGKKSRNLGDTWFPNLINDLCIIWVVIFERDVGTSSEENKRTGPMLRFVRAVLRKINIKKSDDTIVKAIRKWKHRYMVKVEN